MATKGKRPMRSLTPSDKIDAIQRVNDGESKASVARDIGVPESTLRGWCKNEDKLRYMTSRISSPDTDKSNDCEAPEKRSRTESPATPASPANSGLDLSTPVATPAMSQPPPPPADVPVELTTKRAVPSPASHNPRERRPDPGANVSTSDISPLSGLGHLPGFTHSHMGVSFNELANQLALIAQQNPGLLQLSSQPASRALRSVRTPKPAHNGVLNLNNGKHHQRYKSHHSDPYRLSKSSHHGASYSSTATQPTQPNQNEIIWYLAQAQQRLLTDIVAKSNSTHPLQLGQPIDPIKPLAAATPINPHLDYNRNPWVWQYYKHYEAAMSVPEDRHKSAAQVPKDKTAENILYSQLTKGKSEDNQSTSTSTEQTRSVPQPRSAPTAQSRVAKPAASPEIGIENKEPSPDKSHESSRSRIKARTVLDNLLFNNNNQIVGAEVLSTSPRSVEWEKNAADALDHGDKFLAWLEGCGHPSVTHMHAHQLRTLLHNLRSRRMPVAPVDLADHATRRK